MNETRPSRVDWRQVDWNVLLSRLSACALGWFRDEGCVEVDSVLPGTAMAAVDLAYDTVLKLLAEDVRWVPPSPGADPFPFIRVVMRHDFLDLVKQGREYKRTTVIDAGVNGDEFEEPAQQKAVIFAGDTAALVKKLHALLGDDVELKEYVTVWLVHGLEKRADIAYSLGVSEQEVTNRYRRLLYKLRPWRRVFTRPPIGEKEKHG